MHFMPLQKLMIALFLRFCLSGIVEVLLDDKYRSIYIYTGFKDLTYFKVTGELERYHKKSYFSILNAA